MKLVRECKKADEEKKDGASHKRPLVEGIAKKAAVAALALGMSVMVSSCTASWGPGEQDGGDRDAIVDAQDGDVDNDVDRDGDAGPDIDEDAGVDGADVGPDIDEDAGVDAGPDEDLDAGVDGGDEVQDGADVGPDEDLDAGGDEVQDGADVGPDEDTPPCEDVYEGARTGFFYMDTDVEVGGYDFRYVEMTADGIVMDIRCVSSGADVQLGIYLVSGVEHIIERPEDGNATITGMRIRIKNISRTDNRSHCSANVEAL